MFILSNFFIDFYVKDYFLQLFFDKNFLLQVAFLQNLFLISFYKILKSIFVNFWGYIIHFYWVVFYSQGISNFSLRISRKFIVLKKKAFIYWRYFMKRLLKPRKYYKLFYRFSGIRYLRVFYFLFFLGILLLMWSRRNTYLKRTYIVNYVLFYLLYFYFVGFFFFIFFGKSFYTMFLSLLVSFLLINLRLS